MGANQTVTVSETDGVLTSSTRTARTRWYTYVAWVQRVIDGDTLIATVDLGLGHQTRPQRFRLRGIDHGCTDAYGRYLADIRYLPGQPDPEVVRRRGRYLNRELLDQHLARRYLR